MTHRILIVANQTLGGEDLAAMVRERVRSGATELWVVVPATQPRDRSASPAVSGGATAPEGSEDNHAHVIARQRLQAAEERFAVLGVPVGGEVGDANPFQAVSDVLGRREIDEVIVSTLPAGTSQWLRTDLPRRVQREFKIPVTRVIGRVGQRV
jgi:hypothetical protein